MRIKVYKATVDCLGDGSSCWHWDIDGAPHVKLADFGAAPSQETALRDALEALQIIATATP